MNGTCIKSCGKEVRAKNKKHCQECFDKLARCKICEVILYDANYDICIPCFKKYFNIKNEEKCLID